VNNNYYFPPIQQGIPDVYRDNTQHSGYNFRLTFAITLEHLIRNYSIWIYMSESITTMISPLAGKPASTNILVDISTLITAYYTEIPDPSIMSQRVLFGTSGHRGSAVDKTFNEWHILAITQAICLFRSMKKLMGHYFSAWILMLFLFLLLEVRSKYSQLME
jgi:hypothetical protein